MPLQAPNLIMVGLGTLNDAPPNTEQPRLIDAVHVRWGFKRDLGFPWHGFYLFRRVHNAGTFAWLSQHTGQFSKGTHPSATLETPLGQISSDKNLVLTDDFPPPNVVEFDLSDRSYLRVTFPAENPARHIETRIGFRTRAGDPPPTRNTVSFTGRSAGRGQNPRTEQGVIFETRDANDRPRPQTFIRSVQTSAGSITGLGCKFKLHITLPQPATFVEVTVTGASRSDRPQRTPTIETFNQDGSRSDSASMSDPGSRTPETFILTGTAITRIVIDEQHPEGQQDEQDRVILNELSYGRASVSEVQLTAFAAAVPLRQMSIRGYAGRVVTAAIRFEGIEGVELKAITGVAALIDLGIVPFSQNITAGWERVPEFQYPMRLPITHPDYPCTPQTSEDFVRAKELAAARIKYGDPAKFTSAPVVLTNAGTIVVTNGSPVVIGAGTNWTREMLDGVLQVTGDNTVYTVASVDSPTRLVLTRNYSGVSQNAAQYVISRDRFGQLYSYLVSLVQGGAVAGPMVSRAVQLPRSDTQTAPQMPVQSPLDMVLLGSLHPAVAQMTGLYWADRTTDAAQSYDYLIVGDYNGVAELNADKMLAHLQQSGFSSVEASIVYNVRMAPAPPLDKPEELTVYALPGSSRRTATDDTEEAVNNVGLRWNLNKTNLGVLLPGRAIMYHVWCARLGNDATPSTSARYDLLSRDQPVLIAENGRAPQRAPDWPPFPLHALDNALADGWYSYQVSGIDIFGRHTPNSAAGVWRQWAPPPEPRPWYYKDPASDAVIHASAIRLLTKIAPPTPSGVEAYALDPADPTVIKDAAYSDWWNKLNNSKWYRDLSEAQRKNLIGLRVRWLWPQAHMLQAPHTREFRIYYAPGHLNALLGNTQAVDAAGPVESDVTTDIPNAAPANSYAGAALYAGEDAFSIVGSQAGSLLRARVKNVGPDADIMPAPNAPCTVAIPAAYARGTVSVVNGSTLVTGDGTRWSSALAVMLFQIPTDGRSYRVAAINSETELVLEQAYTGVSRSDRVYSIRHPLFVDYSLPRSWERRYHVVDIDKNWTARTDAAGEPVRQYEIFLPAPQDGIAEDLRLNPSLAEPIVYAHIGISAADDKTYTADDPKWTGRWAGRVGNEGRVGPPAKIFRILREPPLPPSVPRMPERVVATRADANGASFYTYRWHPIARTKTHVFRALDTTLFEVDWSQRPRPSLDASNVEFFPSQTTDPRWTTAKREQVAAELNQLNTFARDSAGTAQAFTYYRGLSPDALRILAGLTGNEAAFTPVTVAPLDPADPTFVNRRGPDDPDDFQINDPNNPLAASSLKMFVDTLNGRTSNRYIYRAAYVDAAQNRSALSVATPPVQVPGIVPPRVPVIAKATAGDREITIRWMLDRDPSIARYHVYQTDDQDRARTTELMTLVHTRVPPTDPTASAELAWTNSPVSAGKDLFYRLVAEDRDHNLSPASAYVVARAFDGSHPEPPAWGTPANTPTGLLLNFTPAQPSHRSFIQRRDVESLAGGWTNLTPWLAAGVQQWTDTTREEGRTYVYRIRVLDPSGKINKNFNELTA